MLIEYKFDEDLNCLLIHVIGQLEHGPFATFTDDVIRMTDLGPTHKRLTDLRQALAPASSDVVYAIAEQTRRLDAYYPDVRAGLVTDADLLYGMVRMYIVRRDPDSMHVNLFRDIAAAMHWLELPEAVSDPFAPDYWNRQPALRIE